MIFNKVVFNQDHYLKVYRFREAKGLPTLHNVIGPNSGEIENSPLIGKEIVRSDGVPTKKKMTVQSAHKHWLRGWYVMLLYYTLTDKGERSHGTLFWEDINCHDKTIKGIIKQSNKKYKTI